MEIHHNHIRKTKVGLFTLIFFFGMGLSSCKHEDILLKKPNEDISTLSGYIANNFDFTLLQAALVYTGLNDSLDKSGPYTILAPDNQSFNELGIYRPSDFNLLNRDSLREQLSHHILPYKLMQEDIPLGIDIAYRTLNGESIKAARVAWSTVKDGRTESVSNLYFSGAYVEIKDKVLSNGVLFSIDRVIKKTDKLTVQDWLRSHKEYSIFITGLKHFGLWDELNGEGLFTIFAPRDEIFLARGITAGSINAMDPSEYVGARLFGAYIMYGKNYFINDWEYYFRSDRTEWLALPLRNDPHFKQYFMGRIQYQDHKSVNTDLDNDAYRKVYSLGISEEEAPYNYAQVFKNSFKYNHRYFPGWDAFYFLGSGTEDRLENLGLYRARNDNQCKNGIVHDLSALLVLPEEAKRTN